MRDALEVVLNLLELVASRNQILHHDGVHSRLDALCLFCAEADGHRVLINDVVGGFRPRVVQEGVDLDLAPEPRVIRVLGQRQPFLLE